MAVLNLLTLKKVLFCEQKGLEGCHLCLFFADAEHLSECVNRLRTLAQGQSELALQLRTLLKPSSSSADDLSSLATLIGQNREFQKLLNIHNTIQTVQCFQCPPVALCSDSRDLVAQVNHYKWN